MQNTLKHSTHLLRLETPLHALQVHGQEHQVLGQQQLLGMAQTLHKVAQQKLFVRVLRAGSEGVQQGVEAAPAVNAYWNCGGGMIDETEEGMR